MSTKPAVSAAFMPLFSMKVLHEYRGGAAYDAFTMLPLGATAKVLRRFGWIAGQMENTFTLYAEDYGAILRTRAAADLKARTAAAPDAPDLCFAIQFRDPDFAKYTDLHMPPGFVLAYAYGPMPVKNEQPPFFAASVASEANLVPVHSRSFECPVPAAAAKGDCWVENLGGEKVLELPASIRKHVTVDTTLFDVGFYRILFQKKIIYPFTKFECNFSLQTHSILSISLNLMFEVVQLFSSNSKSPQGELKDDVPCFQLTLPTRSTIWRYDFFNHSAATAQDYDVVPADLADSAAQAPTPPLFHHVEGVPGLGGEISLAFESIHPIPLTAHPDKRFKLWRHQKTLIADLPTPGLDFIRAGEDSAPPSSRRMPRSSQIIHL